MRFSNKNLRQNKGRACYPSRPKRLAHEMTLLIPTPNHSAAAGRERPRRSENCLPSGADWIDVDGWFGAILLRLALGQSFVSRRLPSHDEKCIEFSWNERKYRLTKEQSMNILEFVGDLKILEAGMGIVFQEVVTVSALLSFAAAVVLWAEGIIHIFAAY